MPPGLYLASVTQRLRLQLMNLNCGTIYILLTYLFTYPSGKLIESHSSAWEIILSGPYHNLIP